ncbi:MAG: TolC family protein [Planctomycetota bacterium]
MRLALAIGLALLTGCNPHQLREEPFPDVPIPEAFARQAPFAETSSPTPSQPWWEAFGEPQLNETVEQALTANLDLQQAWNRLRQVIAQARAAGSGRYPEITATAGASLTRTVDRDQSVPGLRSEQNDDRYFVGGSLSYEIDIWRRVASQRGAAESQVQASREDLEATALLLSGTATELWFTILEQSNLERLVASQVATGEQFLELTELRFSIGEGSAVDVLQQRQQVAQTTSELPVVRSNLEVAENTLAVLLGLPPGTAIPTPAVQAGLPDLPPFPQLLTPEELFASRPDLQAEMRRLEAADLEIAVAVAERLPRLGISLSYEFSGDSLSRIFEREMGTLLGNIVTPLLDGGRRKAEVERRRAIVEEQLDRLGQAFLDALLEVENALVRERYQRDLLERLEQEAELSRQNLDESRSRYANALTDYLSVLVALQTLQGLERRLIAEKTRLLLIRGDLYRALGGKGWTSQLEPPASEQSPTDAARATPSEESSS